MTSRSCELHSTEWGKGKNSTLKQVLIGTITLEDGKLTSKAEKGNELEMKNIMKQAKDQDPEDWFEALPENFDGVALRAKMVGESDDESES